MGESRSARARPRIDGRRRVQCVCESESERGWLWGRARHGKTHKVRAIEVHLLRRTQEEQTQGAGGSHRQRTGGVRSPARHPLLPFPRPLLCPGGGSDLVGSCTAAVVRSGGCCALAFVMSPHLRPRARSTRGRCRRQRPRQREDKPRSQSDCLKMKTAARQCRPRCAWAAATTHRGLRAHAW